jgi:hypothetical protein
MMDTMGFTSEVEVAFQTYFINRYLVWSEYKGPEYKGRTLARADTALKNLELSSGQM